MKVEKGIKPPKGGRRRGNPSSKYDFDKMEPGDSFYYTGSRNSPIMNFAYRAIRGLYETWPEGEGFRFRLKVKPPWLRKKLNEQE